MDLSKDQSSNLGNNPVLSSRSDGVSLAMHADTLGQLRGDFVPALRKGGSPLEQARNLALVKGVTEG